MLGSTFLLVLASEGNGTLLDVNPGLIFWTVVTFLILLFVLKKTAWKPILAALDQRENAIREALERAEKAKEEAQKLLDQNKADQMKAEDEAKKIIEQSRAYAEKIREDLMKKSKEDANKLVENAMTEIDRKKTEAFEELKGQIANIAVNAAEKILKQNLDRKAQEKIVDTYLSEIKKN
ncbi:MAG: F0F1 ATP synthase subunit B [Syntrophothermus sp.]|nr:F0F1 ATP synthase subunit B [Ignavibacteriaceae bacterium]